MVGHTHQPMWFRCQDGIVVNPGSVVSACASTRRERLLWSMSNGSDVTFHDVESGPPVEIEPWN